jgi:hypothetical protein
MLIRNWIFLLIRDFQSFKGRKSREIIVIDSIFKHIVLIIRTFSGKYNVACYLG